MYLNSLNRLMMASTLDPCAALSAKLKAIAGEIKAAVSLPDAEVSRRRRVPGAEDRH